MQKHNTQQFDPMLSILAEELDHPQVEMFPNCIIRNHITLKGKLILILYPYIFIKKAFNATYSTKHLLAIEMKNSFQYGPGGWKRDKFAVKYVTLETMTA